MNDTEMKEKIKTLLDETINPAIAMHGGQIELIDVENAVVTVQMSGGCQGCGAAEVTLRAGVEQLLREEIPEIQEIRDTTDHGAGSNPYYAPAK